MKQNPIILLNPNPVCNLLLENVKMVKVRKRVVQ